MALFSLPRLQLRSPIVDREGRPTTFFQRFFNVEFSGTLERQEKRQDEQQAALEAQQAELSAQQAALQSEVDRLNRVLAGTEPFSGLNVGGTNVKPFLDKTDGDKLVDPTGLNDEVVLTSAIEINGVTDKTQAYDNASVSIAGSGDVLLQTATVTTTATDRLEIKASAAVIASGKNGAAIGQIMGVVLLKLKRDGVVIYGAAVSPVLYQVTIPILITPIWADSPGAGTFTYTLESSLSNPGDTSSAAASARYLSLDVFKR